MATGMTTTRQGEIQTYFSYTTERFAYLMKGAKSMRTFEDIQTNRHIFQIFYNDNYERAWTFEDLHDLSEQLQAANNNMAPKEAWQFHH
jgi:hypothetical protein